MKAETEKAVAKQSQAVAGVSPVRQLKQEPEAQFEDRRPAAVGQRALAGKADSSPQVGRIAQLQAMADGSAVGTIQRLGLDEEEPLQGKFGTIQKQEEEEELQMKSETIQRQGPEEEELLQGKFETAQRQGAEEEEELLQGKFKTVQKQPEEEELLQGKFEAIQKQGSEEEEIQTKSAMVQKKDEKPANNTGLPDTLKSGIENLSGLSLDDVKVHYNSPKPAQLQAHAFAQGTDIHMAPGQEKHLPHEAWHVVQQKQGRVKPTRQMKGEVKVNDDAGLEMEADVMGARASQLKSQVNGSPASEREDTGNRARKRISDCDRTVAQRQPTTETVVQRADGEEAEAEASKGWLSRIWTGFKKHGTWMMLVAEAIGHLVVTVAQSGLAAAGALWNIVSAVCQFFIGGGKMFRAYLVRRFAIDPNPINQLENTSFNGIIAFEGALGVISAVFSGLANIADLSKAATYLPKIGSIVGSVIKTIRGAVPKGPKWLRGLVTALEGISGLVGNIGNAVENSGKVFENMGKVVAFGASKFVGAVKTVRGLKGMFEGKKGKGDTAGSTKEQIAGLQAMQQDEEVSEDTKKAISVEIKRLGVKLPSAAEAAAEGHKFQEHKDLEKFKGLEKAT